MIYHKAYSFYNISLEIVYYIYFIVSLLFLCSFEILIINDHNFIMNSHSIKSSKEKSSLSSDNLKEHPKK